MHLFGRLGIRRIQELESDTTDHTPIACFGDDVGGRDIPDRAATFRPGSDSARDESTFVHRQHVTEQVSRPSAHDSAGNDVLAKCKGLDVATWSNDRYSPGGNVLARRDSENSAVVVNMGVGE